VSRLFQAYVMVDWSASASPKTGKDSVWIGVSKRDVRFRQVFDAVNPPTRDAAMAALAEILADLAKRGEKVLLGFDFPLGYPSGTASRLSQVQPAWKGMWAFLAHHVKDKPDNTNNRFGVANNMNRLMTDQARPFWGCPPKDAQRWLSSTKPVGDFDDVPPQFRLAELATQGKGKAGAKTVWQTFGNGTVGSQAIVGIPRVKKLKDTLGDKSRIWPFETGWKSMTLADLDDVEVVMAEIYPSMFEVKPESGEVIDRAQVRTVCEEFARLDEAGKLGACFGPASGTEPAQVSLVEQEEGWVLGI
jgi:hypothetical protein